MKYKCGDVVVGQNNYPYKVLIEEVIVDKNWHEIYKTKNLLGEKEFITPYISAESIDNVTLLDIRHDRKQKLDRILK